MGDRNAYKNGHQRVAAPPSGRQVDPGVTFVELLVAIVLLGTIVVGTLTALRATIIAGTVDEDHANAYSWLQAGAGAIDSAPYVSCGSNSNAAIVAAYNNSLASAARPARWDVSSGATIAVASVAYLARSASGETWGTVCAADLPGHPASSLSSQLIVIDVTGPGGEFQAQLEVIKSG